MADSWDADDFEPEIAVPVAAQNDDKWEGEDEDDVKDNWEEAAEKADGEAGDKPVATQVKKKKPLKERLAEKETLRKEELAKKLEAKKELTSEEKIAEKLRLQRLQEEADLKLAKEAFGERGEMNLDMDPVSREEFDEFRKLLTEKITLYDKSPHYAAFMDQLIRDLCLGMEGDDVKKLSNTLSVIANEKLKSQKKAKPKKKKPGLSLKDDDIGLYDAYTGGAADDFDDII